MLSPYRLYDGMVISIAILANDSLIICYLDFDMSVNKSLGISNIHFIESGLTKDLLLHNRFCSHKTIPGNDSSNNTAGNQMSSGC